MHNDSPSAHDSQAADERPTHTRYTLLTYLCVVTFILYLDRICMGQAGPIIQKEMGLSDKQLGRVNGAFVLAYGLFMAAAGRLGDRFGSRAVMVGIVIWWSTFTMLTGLAMGFIMLMAIRFVFGAGEAGAFPNCARIVTRWFPPAERGMPNGLLNTAALAGGIIAGPAVAGVIVAIDDHVAPWTYEHWGVWLSGWRCTFLIFGVLGIIWAVAFWYWYRDDPEQHPRVNAAERGLIRSSRAHEQSSRAVEPVPWRLVLRSRNIWLLGLINTCASFATYFFWYWCPRYVQAARNVHQDDSGWMQGVAMAGGAIGSILGGLLADRLLRSFGARGVRAWIGFCGMSGGAVLFMSSIWVDHTWSAVMLMALAHCSLLLMIASWWSTVADISGRHVATLFGLCNSLGIVGGLGSLEFLGGFADWRRAQGYVGRDVWDPAFYVYFVVILTGAVAWLFVNPKRSAVT